MATMIVSSHFAKTKIFCALLSAGIVRLGSGRLQRRVDAISRSVYFDGFSERTKKAAPEMLPGGFSGKQQFCFLAGALPA
jgi:hypothetical protein